MKVRYLVGGSKYCKNYDNPAKMYVNCGHSHHRECRQESRRAT